MSNFTGDLEYCYTIDPAWATEAIVCTTSGVELNFEKLSLLCPAEDLPHQISLQLTSNNNQKNNQHLKGHNITNTPQKYRDSGYTDAKQNQHVPKSLTRTVQNNRTSSTGPQNESIIQREIRVQREREEELKRERQLLHGHRIVDGISAQDIADPEPDRSNGFKYQSEHPMKIEMERIRIREGELRDDKSATNPIKEPPLNNLHETRHRRQSLESTASSSTILSNPTTASASSSQDSNLNSSTTNTSYDNRPRRGSKIVSPICTADNKAPSTWYISESPIERDIRITKEREMEHKTRLN